MTEDNVLYDIADGIAVVTFNRPNRGNAMAGDMRDRFFDLLEAAVDDVDVRAIVVTGAGSAFCVGADVDVLSRLSAKGSAARRAPAPRPWTMPLSVPKPMIAAINGSCAGVGLALALMCDVRFAATGVKLTTAYARRGLIAEHGTSWLLPHLVGRARALELLLSGRVVRSEEAHQMGLVYRVVSPESLVDETLAYAKDLAASCSPSAMAVIKQQVLLHPSMPLDDVMAETHALMLDSWARPDFKEGATSFVEKRPPAFAPLDRGALVRGARVPAEG